MLRTITADERMDFGQRLLARIVERNKLGPDLLSRFHAYDPLTLDLGSRDYTHPDLPGTLFSTPAAVLEGYRFEHGRDCPTPGLIQYRNNSLTVRQVAKAINEMEEAVEDLRRMEEGEPLDGWNQGGYWEESPVSWLHPIRGGDVFWEPGTAWIAVYVVEGSAEGMYLHVDRLMKSNEAGLQRRVPVLQAKTLSWGDYSGAYASAGRIAALLSA